MSDLHKHARVGGLVVCSPRKFLEIRRSEIASEAILGQKQSRSSYNTPRAMLHGSRSIASNFWLSVYAFAKPADFEFSRERVLRLASLEGQLSSA